MPNKAKTWRETALRMWCECGGRADVCKNSVWICERCAELERRMHVRADKEGFRRGMRGHSGAFDTYKVTGINFTP